MSHLIKSLLVQLVAYRLIGAKRISKTKMPYWRLDAQKQYWVEYEYKTFSFKKIISKYRL